MKVYDEVNNLAKAIKESQEYLEYKEIKITVMMLMMRIAVQINNKRIRCR